MGDQIRTATWDDERRIGALMVVAFASDPFARWLLPDPLDYIDDSFRHARLTSSPAFDSGSAYIMGDFFGASIWLPPRAKYSKRQADDPEDQEARFTPPEEFTELMEKSDAYCPDEPYWHLSLIFVDPARRGKGYGAALMKHGLEIIDRQSLPVFLESTNVANLSLYKRHGFKVLAEVQVGQSPARYPMLRPARLDNGP